MAAQQVKDPDLYRREYLAEFVAAGAFLDSVDVLGCVRRGEGVLPRALPNNYQGSIDPAFAVDNFSLGVRTPILTCFIRRSRAWSLPDTC